MAIEGAPAVQTLTYAGQTYEFKAEGLMGDRKVCLKVAGGCYAVTSAKDGGMQVLGMPAAAPLPAMMPKAARTPWASTKPRLRCSWTSSTWPWP